MNKAVGGRPGYKSGGDDQPWPFIPSKRISRNSDAPGEMRTIKIKFKCKLSGAQTE